MWGVYTNGNSICKINLSDGTKIRETQDDEFDLEFPESLDICCTTKCVGANCEFCYANCGPHGEHANPLEFKFIDTLEPYTEAALQFNDLTSPYMIPFLQKLKEKRVIANITVNQIHFERKEEIIKDLVDRDLIKGIGISLRKPTAEFIERVKKYPNAVIHTIVGILSNEDIEKLINNDLKILILGYKDMGRGIDYKANNLKEWQRNKSYLYNVLPDLIERCKLVSFDNLALEQLNVRRLLTEEQWNSFYIGDEGTSSMFVDLVTGKFGISSLASPDEMWPVTTDIKDMFAKVKQEARKIA